MCSLRYKPLLVDKLKVGWFQCFIILYIALTTLNKYCKQKGIWYNDILLLRRYIYNVYE